MKRKWLGIFLAILMTISICLFGCRKTDTQMIMERIESFEKSYNDGDLESFTENFAAKEKNKLNATFSVISLLMGGLLGIGLDLSDLFSLSIGMQEGDWLQVSIDEIRILDETTALVKTLWVYTQETLVSSTEKAEMYFIMRKENENWYIKDMTENTPAEWNDLTE